MFTNDNLSDNKPLSFLKNDIIVFEIRSNEKNIEPNQIISDKSIKIIGKSNTTKSLLIEIYLIYYKDINYKEFSYKLIHKVFVNYNFEYLYISTEQAYNARIFCFCVNEEKNVLYFSTKFSLCDKPFENSNDSLLIENKQELDKETFKQKMIKENLQKLLNELKNERLSNPKFNIPLFPWQNSPHARNSYKDFQICNNLPIIEKKNTQVNIKNPINKIKIGNIIDLDNEPQPKKTKLEPEKIQVIGDLPKIIKRDDFNEKIEKIEKSLNDEIKKPNERKMDLVGKQLIFKESSGKRTIGSELKNNVDNILNDLPENDNIEKFKKISEVFGMKEPDYFSKESMDSWNLGIHSLMNNVFPLKLKDNNLIGDFILKQLYFKEFSNDKFLSMDILELYHKSVCKIRNDIEFIYLITEFGITDEMIELWKKQFNNSKNKSNIIFVFKDNTDFPKYWYCIYSSKTKITILYNPYDNQKDDLKRIYDKASKLLKKIFLSNQISYCFDPKTNERKYYYLYLIKFFNLNVLNISKKSNSKNSIVKQQQILEKNSLNNNHKGIDSKETIVDHITTDEIYNNEKIEDSIEKEYERMIISKNYDDLLNFHFI